MCVARLAVKQKRMEQSDYDEIEKTLQMAKLPTSVPANLDRDRLLAACGFDKKREGDDPMDRIDRLQTHVDALAQQLHSMTAHTRVVERRLRWWRGLALGMLLVALMGLPLHPGEESRNILPAEVLGIRYVASVHRLLRGLADRGPTVVVLEDIHWADPASIDAARQLIPLAAQLPILFVGVLRAESDAPGWALIGQAREVFGDAVTEIRLDPLSDADSRALVANLLEVESLPNEVRDLIMARAEGNPFFVEEVVRMLIDRGVIVPQGDRWVATGEIGGVEIPESLHGLLLARIDQLPESAKRSLRIAAVIGRQFPVRVLERVVSEA